MHTAFLNNGTGPATREFARGRGGETGASPQRAVTVEPTKAAGKRLVARRAGTPRAVGLRCASVTDRSRVCSLVVPCPPALGLPTGPIRLFRQALRILLYIFCLYIGQTTLLSEIYMVEGILITDRHWYTNESVHVNASKVPPLQTSRSNLISQFKPERYITNLFRISVSNCYWSVSTITLGKARQVQSRLLFDGTNIISIEIFQKEPGAVNNSVARIYASHVPMATMPSYADIAWAFWGSSYYFSTNIRPYLLSRRTALTQNQSSRVSVGDWDLTPERPNLPRFIKVFSGMGSDNVTNINDSNWNIEDTYQVLAYTNVQGIKLPSFVVYKLYDPRKPKIKYNKQSQWETVSGEATNVCINAVEVEHVSGVVSATTDLRSEYYPVTYLMTNLSMPATNDPVFLNAVNTARDFSENNTLRLIYPNMFAVGIVLMVLLPLLWLVRRKMTNTNKSYKKQGMQ